LAAGACCGETKDYIFHHEEHEEHEGNIKKATTYIYSKVVLLFPDSMMYLSS
jgi:hypothetical protein